MNWKVALDKKGFKLGGDLMVVAADGRSRRFKVNRKAITIKLKRGHESQFTSGQIILPAIKEEGEFVIEWDEDRGSYTMRGLKSVPFIQNRSFAVFTYPMDQDEVFLDYNKLHFLNPPALKQNFNEEKLPYQWPMGVPFLVEGETGTGKSTLAKKLHNQFVGEDNPFIGINLSAFNPSLIESELFGHEKGSFTGAIKDKKGAIELAHGGTLFLDEMDSLDKAMQVKLLTFLDDLTFRRVGGEKELKSDCRIIFASGRNLKSLVLDGDFRADLFYRINFGISLKLPTLRDHPELIEKEIKDFAKNQHLFIDKDLVDFYKKCKWPGNYRQLYSHLKRKELQHFSSRKLAICLLDYELERWESEDLESQSLDLMKKNYCRKMFLRTRGNYTLAAQNLDISVNTLRKMIA